MRRVLKVKLLIAKANALSSERPIVLGQVAVSIMLVAKVNARCTLLQNKFLGHELFGLFCVVLFNDTWSQ